MRRVRRRMLAMKAIAVAEAMVLSQSFASLRQRPSHAKVRSTTHRRGRISKPLGSVTRKTWEGRARELAAGNSVFEGIVDPRPADLARIPRREGDGDGELAPSRTRELRCGAAIRMRLRVAS
jgi:hypothetical protein